MAHKLVVRNKLPVQVKGTLKGEDGKPVEFDFVLKCKRLNQAEIDAMLANKAEPVKQFLHTIAEGWDGVLDDQGGALPFNAENFDAMLNNDPGMQSVCFQSYLRDVGAVAKN
jgi:hypothetical protein